MVQCLRQQWCGLLRFARLDKKADGMDGDTHGIEDEGLVACRPGGVSCQRVRWLSQNRVQLSHLRDYLRLAGVK